MSAKQYVVGCYRLLQIKGVIRIPEVHVVWYDGENWWVPGWECGLIISDYCSEFSIHESEIGELLWAKPT